MKYSTYILYTYMKFGSFLNRNESKNTLMKRENMDHEEIMNRRCRNIKRRKTMATNKTIDKKREIHREESVRIV